jgi:citrate lyase subunit beta / citryl-CoA lyase
MDRSYLFVPGDRSDRFDKALASVADRVIVDLEDAVPIGNKAAARAAVAQWLRPDKSVIVRVNSADTEWFQKDIQLASIPGVAGLMVPKAEELSAELIELCGAHQKFIIPMIETAVGFQSLSRLAATPNVQRIAFGSIDFQVDLGIPGEGNALLFFRSQIVLQSRIGNLPAPLDGVTVDINNTEQLTADAEYAKQLGFGAKLCIHPKQVETVNQVFSPSAQEIAWAARVIEAIAASNGAAVAVDGKMVDRPVLLKAKRIQSAVERSPRKSN